jgi:hypothetical protein
MIKNNKTFPFKKSVICKEFSSRFDFCYKSAIILSLGKEFKQKGANIITNIEKL